MKSVSRSNVQQCDWCSQILKKVHRRYKGEIYCINCYKTWFIVKKCMTCGLNARLHKKEKHSICEKCKRKQPCIRCGKSALKYGSTTKYGRVCKSCYQNYFKEKKICDVCYQLNRSVFRDKENHNRVTCLSCYRKKSYKTCPECRKYRKLITTEGGERCKKCALYEKVNCKRCKKIMSASFGTYCWDCYWLNKTEYDMRISCYIFDSHVIKRQYCDFIKWLSLKYKSNIASMRVNKYINFFIACDRVWSIIPDYQYLLEYFKPLGLRKNLVVMKWLYSALDYEVDEDAKLELSELTRIDSLLNKFKDEIPVCINKYYIYLFDKLKREKIKIKTIRMALQPAIDIMLKFDLKNNEIINQEQVNIFLIEKYGQRNTLSGFLSFINNEYKLNLKCIKKGDSFFKLKRRIYLEKELFKLSKGTELLHKDKIRWVRLSMEYFHNIIIRNKKYNYIYENNFLIIEVYFNKYAIPYPF